MAFPSASDEVINELWNQLKKLNNRIGKICSESDGPKNLMDVKSIQKLLDNDNPGAADQCFFVINYLVGNEETMRQPGQKGFIIRTCNSLKKFSLEQSEELQKYIESISDEVKKLYVDANESYQNTWWCNQDGSYQADFDSGTIWAPLISSNGQSLKHDKNVSEVEVGDRILHYAQGKVMAYSICRKSFIISPRRNVSDEPDREGFLVEVEYFPYENPISFTDLTPNLKNLADEAEGPFDKNKNVKEGYLFSLTDDFASKFFQLYPEKIMETNRSNYMDRDVVIDTRDYLLAYRNVILEGVAGTGKTYTIKKLLEPLGVEPKDMRLVVFHPSTSYEDFVEGLRPTATGENDFEVKDGVFLEFLREIVSFDENEHKKFLFVIDEINRANTSKVLGDLLMLIEPSKRVSWSKAREIILDNIDLDSEASVLQNDRVKPSVIDDSQDSSTFRQKIALPDNLFILGTMNTTDRSVGTIDLALRRRFVFCRVNPMGQDKLEAALDGKLGNSGSKSIKYSDLNDHARSDLDKWKKINEVLMNKIGIDGQLGHSYFFEDCDARIRSSQSDSVNIWRDQLLPQVAEILLSFNAMSLLEEINEVLKEAGGTYGLERLGQGVDEYPIVKPFV